MVLVEQEETALLRRITPTHPRQAYFVWPVAEVVVRAEQSPKIWSVAVAVELLELAQQAPELVRSPVASLLQPHSIMLSEDKAAKAPTGLTIQAVPSGVAQGAVAIAPTFLVANAELVAEVCTEAAAAVPEDILHRVAEPALEESLAAQVVATCNPTPIWLLMVPALEGPVHRLLAEMAETDQTQAQPMQAVPVAVVAGLAVLQVVTAGTADSHLEAEARGGRDLELVEPVVLVERDG